MSNYEFLSIHCQTDLLAFCMFEIGYDIIWC